METRFHQAVTIVFENQQRLIEENLLRLALTDAALVGALALVSGVPVETDDGSGIEHRCILW